MVIWKEDMDDTIEIIISLENSGILIDGVYETVKNQIKEENSGFRGMLLGTLIASILGNMLIGKDVIRALKGAAAAVLLYKLYKREEDIRI